MKKPIITCAFLFLFIIFFIARNGFVGSKKEDYELQERCGQQATRYFEEQYGNDSYGNEKGIVMYNYAYHYSKKLNKCFILRTVIYIPKDKETLEILGGSLDKELRDVNDNNVYAMVSKFDKVNKPEKCIVKGEKCNSIIEWDTLVKPYMEE